MLARTLLAILLALVVAPLALAQDRGDLWNSPGGSFSVTVPTRWLPFRAIGTDQSNTLLDVMSSESGARVDAARASPRPPNAGPIDLVRCSVRYQSFSGRRTQDQLNHTLAAATQESMLQGASFTTLNSYSNQLEDGIQVVTYDYEQVTASGRQYRTIGKTFYLAERRGGSYYFLSCLGGNVRESPSEAEAMVAFVASLRFARSSMNQ